MKETERITALFDALYDGTPWIYVNIVDTLRGITAEQANTRVLSGRNTIWEIVNHMIGWRLNALQRVQGTHIKTPKNNYVEEVADTSAEAWAATLQRLQESQILWKELLATYDEAKFDQIYGKSNLTYYDHIHGILQHDAYHLGQITMLAKFLQA